MRRSSAILGYYAMESNWRAYSSARLESFVAFARTVNPSKYIPVSYVYA